MSDNAEQAQAFDWQGRDPLLAQLAYEINRRDTSTDFTFIIGGNVFTGTAISHRSYIVAIGGKAENVPLLSENVEQETQQTNFIHLTDVTCITPSGTLDLSQTKASWRLKLSDITGWTEGRAEIAHNR